MIPACRIRDITKEVAAAVIKEAVAEDLAEGYREMDSHELRKLNQVSSSNADLLHHCFFYTFKTADLLEMLVGLGAT